MKLGGPVRGTRGFKGGGWFPVIVIKRAKPFPRRIFWLAEPPECAAPASKESERNQDTYASGAGSAAPEPFSFLVPLAITKTIFMVPRSVGANEVDMEYFCIRYNKERT